MPLTRPVQVSRGTRSTAARVLIVDDSVVARAVISKMIGGNAAFTVVGAVADAQAARAFLQANRVDIILLDIEMPGVDGLSALPDLLKLGQGARIIIVSSSCGEGAAATIQALALGAADTLVKPSLGNLVGRFSDTLEEKLVRLLECMRQDAAAPQSSAPHDAAGDEFDVIAIGASTGGIHALSQVLREIPAHFDVPILITQHLPPSFMPYFAAQIAVLAGVPATLPPITCGLSAVVRSLPPAKRIYAAHASAIILSFASRRRALPLAACHRWTRCLNRWPRSLAIVRWEWC